ncbi:MAG: hypothetical protein E7071_08200 [Bacteroidales bacterium]|nr:hypothetical protein [Bacteroidales bacterium]
MEQAVYYKFVGLELPQFATFEDNYKEDDLNIDISCKFSFAYNSSERVICCSNSIVVSKERVPLIKADLDAYFAINELSVEAISENGEIVLQPALQAQFASLTYGTMRGVIFAKTLNTPLSKVILPPNDVMSIFNQVIRFKVK